MDYSRSGSSVHGLLQASILEWVAILFSRGSSGPWDWTGVSCIAGRFFTIWANTEAQALHCCLWNLNSGHWDYKNDALSTVLKRKLWIEVCDIVEEVVTKTIPKENNEPAGFRKGKGTKIKLLISTESKTMQKKFQKNFYFCIIDYAKAFDCVDNNKLWKYLKRWEYQTTSPVYWETCMQVKKQQSEPDMEKWTATKLGKEYIKTVYFHLAYLTYMKSTSCKMLGWMKHKL